MGNILEITVFHLFASLVLYIV